MNNWIQRMKKTMKHIRTGSVVFVLAVLLITGGIATYVGFRIHDIQ